MTQYRYTVGMHALERLNLVSWTRKIWHISGGCVVIALATLVPWPYSFFIAFAVLLVWISVEAMRRREPWFGRLFFTLSAPFIRHFERRTYMGNTWTALSAAVLSGLFKDPLLLAASFVGWTFGDPAAEIFGKLIPSKKFFSGEKSIAGTIACFVVSFGAFYGFFWIMGTGGDIVAASLTGAAATTLAEMFSLSFSVNDNFTIPLVTALALTYII